MARTMALRPMSVADFYAEVVARLGKLGIQAHIWTMPSEIENAIPLELDRGHAQYDGCHRAYPTLHFGIA